MALGAKKEVRNSSEIAQGPGVLVQLAQQVLHHGVAAPEVPLEPVHVAYHPQSVQAYGHHHGPEDVVQQKS